MRSTVPVVILDFGSQYTRLIAKRIRKLGVYCSIESYSISLERFQYLRPQALILSGSPHSASGVGCFSLTFDIDVLQIPVLGICYGMQLLASSLGHSLSSHSGGEYGKTIVSLRSGRGEGELFCGFPRSFGAWMSHADEVKLNDKNGENIQIFGVTEYSKIAAFRHKNKFLVQFHPEVSHTDFGELLFGNFLFGIAKIHADWTMGNFADDAIQAIGKSVASNERVLCALSGGVDSCVTAVLLHRALGNRLICIFVNHGLLRLGEEEEIQRMLRSHISRIIVVHAKHEFFLNLRGVSDPEEKRKIIGSTFVDVFEREAKKIGSVQFLAQGTLYTDKIESNFGKTSGSIIKSHHNVGGLPERMALTLLEPLDDLFKDDVRDLGLALGLPKEVVFRHPFPGPGLAIRILGVISEERVQMLREADFILISELKKLGLYNQIWQAFAVLLPVKTVGVMGDKRSYEHVVALRCVSSVDGMTAEIYPMPYDALTKISTRIVNEVQGINRVVYDVTSKPPATIEWE